MFALYQFFHIPSDDEVDLADVRLKPECLRPGFTAKTFSESKTDTAV